MYKSKIIHLIVGSLIFPLTQIFLSCQFFVVLLQKLCCVRQPLDVHNKQPVFSINVRQLKRRELLGVSEEVN